MPTKPKNKPTLVAFLLDRTGSMEICKLETIKGFNGYIDTLKKDKAASNMRFTLTQFDTVSIDIVHDAVPLKQVASLNEETYKPRGGTPLYDAIGKTIRATEKQAGEKYKVLFVVQTDGEENSSSEWTSDSVRKLIKQKEDDDKWTFAYIGMGIQGWSATSAIAHGTQSASNVMRSSGKNSVRAYNMMASATTHYAGSTANLCSVDKSVFGSSNPTTEKDDELTQP